MRGSWRSARPDARRTAQRGERGTAAIEMTLMAPLLMVVLLFVVGLGRMAEARQEVESVAADAARAASLERNVSLSRSVARKAAQDSLGSAGMSCGELDVDADLSDYRPGGVVRATVTCTARLTDVAMAGFPGRKKFTATSSVPVETYRGS